VESRLAKLLSIEEVRELASSYKVVPIVTTLFSGTETPLTIFEKLCASRPGSFLLESAEQGVWSRYSFVGVGSMGLLISEAGGLRWIPTGDSKVLKIDFDKIRAVSDLDALEQLQRTWQAAPVEDLPPLVSGMVGFLGWDSIQALESLPKPKEKEYEIPELALTVIQDLIVVDHQESSLKLISNIYIEDNDDIEALYNQALERILLMKQGLLSNTEPFLAEVDHNAKPVYSRRSKDSEYKDMVEKAKVHVRAGDVFQVVLSQRFDIPVTATSLDVYRMLRALNPSPYMYLLNFVDSSGLFSVVGSSPEALVRVSSRQAVLHPIAGSRPRGETAELDASMAEELLQDKKERSEHLMLVDLARNDLLRVCDPDSVSVTEFMNVERYSHIMHLVSTVEGTLRENASAVDVFRATFPAGTLSGAPKPRALEIIEDLEPCNRGIFGGVVGYFDFSGNADLAIAIRTAVIRDGMGYVQAGAGIVLDSNPELENQETIAKASAPLRAIAVANSMKRIRS
jgi:anthranilate synthase component 1